MKIENQVCSLAQAKKLQELGVNYIAQAQYMYVDYATKSGHEFALSRPLLFGDTSWLIVVSSVSEEIQRQLDDETLNACGPVYPALTIAELEMALVIDNGKHFVQIFYNEHAGTWDGNLLTIEETEDSLVSMPVTDAMQEGETGADVRAEMLIYLLEHNIITAAECNESLAD